MPAHDPTRPLPTAAVEFLRRPVSDPARSLVLAFHLWMDFMNIELCALTPSDVQRFLPHPRRRPLRGSTARSYRALLLPYLAWLRRRSCLSFDPACLRPHPAPDDLPALVHEYLDSAPRGSRREQRSLLIALHAWLEKRGTWLMQLTAADVDDFLRSPRGRQIGRRTQEVYRRGVIPYLQWLHEKRCLSFHPRCLRRHPKDLPPIAEQFLRSLPPTHRPSTCRGYTTTLRNLYAWLEENELILEAVRRDELVRWFEHLHHKGLHANTRRHMLVHARAYLRWLAERHPLSDDPDDLIRRSDLPKLPSYLPRPLPPALDHELQRRLAKSRDVLLQGLLLMRRTGLRVGELRSLEYDCVRTDPSENAFLKVPLGKLNTERLVPLDASTREIIGRLQARGLRPRPWLLQTRPGKTPYSDLRLALKRITQDLRDSTPITTHRLRHTYATSLLSAGMSLVGIMNLLGHRDYRMTLRYAAITEETVGKEYREAIEKLEARYQLPAASVAHATPDPSKLLNDVSRWLRSRASHDPSRIRRVLKRLDRLRAEIRLLKINGQ